MCRCCSTNTRRGSNPRWSTISAIAARRCCSRRCCRCARPRRSRPSSSAPSISAAAPGSAAAAFAKEVDHFIGIDLSPRMIEKARATGLYAELEVADMVAGPARQGRRRRRSHPRRRCHGLCRRSRAGACPKPRACWRRAGCSLSRPRRMTARASLLGEGLRYAHSARLRARGGCAAGLKLSHLDESLRPQRGQCSRAGPGGGRDENLSLDATRVANGSITATSQPLPL